MPPPQDAQHCYSAFLGIDEAGAARNDLIIAALGNRRIHLHLAMTLAGNHIRGPTGTFGLALMCSSFRLKSVDDVM